MNIKVKCEYADLEVSLDGDEDGLKASIYIDGALAGTGNVLLDVYGNNEWSLQDCPADLPATVYDAIDIAIDEYLSQ